VRDFARSVISDSSKLASVIRVALASQRTAGEMQMNGKPRSKDVLYLLRKLMYYDGKGETKAGSIDQ